MTTQTGSGLPGMETTTLGICLFQCDICHFTNMMHGVQPEERETDKLCLLTIMTSHPGCLLGRETTTVEANIQEGVRCLHEAQAMGILNPCPSRGLFAIKDEWGLGMSVVLPSWSLDSKGRKREECEI
jgi:hypothetical protein